MTVDHLKLLHAMGSKGTFINHIFIDYSRSVMKAYVLKCNDITLKAISMLVPWQ